MDSTLPERRTALVTGASQGIGFALAEEMARRGYDLFLVSTPSGPLPQKAALLMEKYPVRVHCMLTDLTRIENCEAVFREVMEKQVTISVLINNAGMGSTGVFEEYPLSFYRDQISLNVSSVVYLTHLFLPMLIARPEAYILNVGSLGGFFHMPHKEVYVGTKAFVHSFTGSLRIRLSGTGVRVSVLAPGPVNTNPRLHELNATLKGIERRTVMPVETVSAMAISGLFAGRRLIIPGRLNRILLWIDGIVPDRLKHHLIRSKMMKQAHVKHERMHLHTGKKD
jgi:hypothetical protein